MKSLILFVNGSQISPPLQASAAQAKPTLIKLALDCLLCLVPKGSALTFPEYIGSLSSDRAPIPNWAHLAEYQFSLNIN